MIDPTGHEVHGPDLEPPNVPEETAAPDTEGPELVADPTVEAVEPEELHVASNVCEVCQHDNLLQKVGIVYCGRCKGPFCIHFSSKIDPQYCVDCCSEVSVEKNDITYERNKYNALTDTWHSYRRRAKEIKISGLDWLFMQRRIYDLTDAELDLAIEYHRNYQSLLLVEAEARRNNKAHKDAAVKQISLTHSTTTTTTTVKKSSTISSTKAQAQVAALLTTMFAKGMTKEQLAALLSGK